MATRFYLPASGSAAVSPTISGTDWAHINTVRRPLNSTNGGSVITTTAFAPDVADHLVAGNAHFCQFVSEVLPPQIIAAQSVKLQARAAEDNANNNLFLVWKIYAVTEDGSSVLGTLLALRADNTEAATALTNRTDSATTTAFTATQNFRLVLEVGLGGTPTATSGVQGHNGSISFGENAATDLPEDDAATGALNPWLQFAQSLKFRIPTAVAAGWITIDVAIAIGDPASPAGWTVTQNVLSMAFPFENRMRITWLFRVLKISEFALQPGAIIVLMVSDPLSQALTDRIREVKDRLLPLRKVCVLDNGLKLSDLTPAQIAARVG